MSGLIFIIGIFHLNVCSFTPKLSDSPRKPQPVFIDTVGLFSPNEVCSCEVLKAVSQLSVFFHELLS